ncbi:PREDICTED: protein tesmin/TSO1-like CXC 2 isoform X2 [Tarenaya hassleriana]|uniref:protein tesmin/TSO1-like CXC 2 isoform X2 n=1 Tax=Tarenaya hassleriana TaxID=28532 RepID=UPI00053C5DEB|nr:PREDICTED: protein tesmin/TSO1-like CXC 2 isoform X2 [Tarenaya hassleriana]
MDSPESSTAKVNPDVNTDAAVNVSRSLNSPSVQESPFSHFVSTFSPLTLGDSSRSSHVFLGLNSPPAIFTTPRANPVHESGLVISDGNTQASNEEEKKEKGNENQDKEPRDCVNWDKPAIDLDACLANDSRATATDNDDQVQSSGSSECVDRYLADNAEEKSTWLDHTVDQKLKHIRQVLEISPSNADTATCSSLNVMADYEKEMLTKGLIEEDAKGKGVLGGGQGTGREESEKVGCEEERKFPSEIPSEHMQTVQSLEDPNNNVESLLSKPNDIVVLESEGNQQRGMSRRCLQFEEAQPKANSNTNSSLAMTAFLRPVSAPSESDPFDSSTSSCSRHLTDTSPTVTDVPCSATNIKQIAPASKPLGIGVHLNSIIKTVPFHHDGNASLKPSDRSMSVLEIRSKVIADTSPPQITNDEFLQDPEDFMSLQIIDDLATPGDKRKFVPENPDHFEQHSQLSPKKKKLSSSPDDDGNKRCNCKKTKCLKLYCDCFAAGVYCDESCACQGCLNKPEHAETVLQTRQQIESRNPLAFAPKIIQSGSDFSMSNMETGTLTTPASARHKRGCNCKKSMCLKKYCECYQGGVGCSSGCRCENCKNIYGKKDEFLSSREITERPEPDRRMDLAVARKSSLQAETYHMHKLTPVTPSLQHSDRGKVAPKSQIIIRRCNHPPDSDPRSLRHSDGTDPNPEASVEATETSSYNHKTSQNSPEMAGFGPVTTNPLPTPTGCSSTSLCTSPTFGSGSGVFNVREDGYTHEILTDASMAIKPVKVCSPSRKRVSPPRSCLSQAGSSSSVPLRSGRKFILKALPPFPPLTPCVENKSITPEDNPQPE